MNLENVSRVTISFVGGLASAYLGGYDSLLIFYFYLIIVDFITGLLKAKTEKNINSQKIYLGVSKKVVTLLIIGIAVQLEHTFGDTIPIREMVIMFYIVNEATSLIENASVFTPIPESFTQYFEQLKERGKNEK